MFTIALSPLRGLHRLLMLSLGLTCSPLVAQTTSDVPPPSTEFHLGPKGTLPVAFSQEAASAEKQNAEKTEVYIGKWKEAVEKTKRLECFMEITGLDKVFDLKAKSSASYQFLKIKQQAETKSYWHLDLKQQSPNNNLKTKIINNNVYDFNYDSKIIRFIDYGKLTDKKKKEMRIGFFSSFELALIEWPLEIVYFISSPNQILEKHTVILEKEDPYYLYFSLCPKSQEGQSATTRCQLVLLKSTFLVRRIWWAIPNGETCCDFTRMSLTPELKPSDFAPLDRENFKGWTIRESPNNH